MRIKCPSCGTAGRVPSKRLPATGANIRCPSCQFVFFVGGPDGLNLDGGGTESEADAAALPTARDTQTLPRDITEQVRALAERARLLASEQAARGDSGLGDAATNSTSGVGTAAAAASPSSSGLGSRTPSPSSSSLGAAKRDPASSNLGGNSSREPSTSSLGSSSRSPSPSSLGSPARDPGASNLGSATRNPSSSSLGSSSRDPSASGMGASQRDGSQSGLGNRAKDATPRNAGSPASGTPSVATNASETTEKSTNPAAEEPTGLDALAALAAAAESANDAARPAEETTPNARPKVASGSLPAVDEKPWRVRAEGDMVYDFIDTSATRRWMSSRGTLDELECSSDGGKTWTMVVDEPAFADVRAGGLRSRTTTGSMRAVTLADEVDAVRAMRQTGSVPSVPAPTRTTQSTATASASETRASRQTEAAESYEPIAGRKILLVLTLLLSIAVAVVYFRPQEELPYGISIPNSPAGQRLSWVMLQITGGSARLTAADLPAQFSDDAIARATPERLLSTLAYFDDWSPKYTILRWLERPTDHRIVGLLETPGGHRGIVEIQTEPTPPFKIQGMLFRDAR